MKMIFDSVKNRENYKEHPLIYQALSYLGSLPEGELPASGQVLIPDVLFCNPVTLISRPEEECIYEAHRNYADLHYIVEGTEGIATADVSALQVTTPYDGEKDILFLKGEEDGRYYLKPGQFMVCWPNDAHKVAIMRGQPEQIRKIVCKIRMEESLEA
jgi:biofilm protein TabA